MSALPGPDDALPVRRYLDRPEAGPTVLRIVVGAQLRRLRRERGITPEAAGRAIRASHAKISRLERGQVGFKTRDLEDLLTLYGVHDPDERSDYLALGRRANRPGWWHEYSDVLEDWFELHIGLEESAQLIRTYEVQFLPGLLQTEAYARAVTRIGYPDAPGARSTAWWSCGSPGRSCSPGRTPRSSGRSWTRRCCAGPSAARR